MTDLAISRPALDASVIPAVEVDALITSVSDRLEQLEAQVQAVAVAVERAESGEVVALGPSVGERIDLLCWELAQVDAVGEAQQLSALEAAHAHAAARIAAARAQAEDLVLQAHVDRATQLAELTAPAAPPLEGAPPAGPAGLVRTIAAPPAAAPLAPPALEPLDVEREEQGFAEFWQVEHEALVIRAGRRDGYLAIGLGIVGALVLILIALALLG